MEEIPLLLVENLTDEEGPIVVEPTVRQPPASRHAVSLTALEELKIDSFSAMAKLALPDVRPELVQEAKKRLHTREIYKEIVERLLHDL